ncbi:unnamed protein product [Nyctereutes procyonoides]|uniref:(raccoon dog) hypothetical protein n=1 Tax=Nyctereutes procyonoides TaxID=34880 RepID=A0A811YYY7_NYCPR|nr:unnamed protein product [Nyctereutes procyonoides]
MEPAYPSVCVSAFSLSLSLSLSVLILPEKNQGKVWQATLVAVGSGSKGRGGKIQLVRVTVGDQVLLPEYGGTRVVLDDEDYFLFRDGDILGKYVD